MIIIAYVLVWWIVGIASVIWWITGHDAFKMGDIVPIIFVGMGGIITASIFVMTSRPNTVLIRNRRHKK